MLWGFAPSRPPTNPPKFKFKKQVYLWCGFLQHHYMQTRQLSDKIKQNIFTIFIFRWLGTKRFFWGGGGRGQKTPRVSVTIQQGTQKKRLLKSQSFEAFKLTVFEHCGVCVQQVFKNQISLDFRHSKPYWFSKRWVFRHIQWTSENREKKRLVIERSVRSVRSVR